MLNGLSRVTCLFNYLNRNLTLTLTFYLNFWPSQLDVVPQPRGSGQHGRSSFGRPPVISRAHPVCDTFTPFDGDNCSQLGRPARSVVTTE